MNINEEGKYYASMVRKFRTEYKSKNLHGFCKEQKVSYTKMLHCLRSDSYRKPSATPVSSDKEQGLHPLVVEPVFDEKKGCYHISWESFVYLVEGIVLKDRKVAFNDLNDENDEELGMDIEESAQGKIDEKELLKEAI